MWVLVAKLKKEGTTVSDTKADGRQSSGEFVSEYRINGSNEKDTLKEPQAKALHDTTREEPLVARLMARVQEMKEKEKEVKYVANGDTNSHLCKVCFESATAAILLPVNTSACVNLAPLRVPSALFAVQL